MDHYKMLPMAGLIAAAAFGLGANTASAAVPALASQGVSQRPPIIEQVRYRHYRHTGYYYGYGGRYCNRAPAAAAADATGDVLGGVAGGLFGLGEAAVSVPGAVVGAYGPGYGYGYAYGGYPSYGYAGYPYGYNDWWW